MEKRPPYAANLLRDTLAAKLTELEKEPASSKWPLVAGVVVILIAAGVAANLFLAGKEKKEEVHPSKFEKKLLATVEVRDVPPPPPAIKEVENRTANRSAEQKKAISELLKGKKLVSLDTNAREKATETVTVTQVKMRFIHNPKEKERALRVLKKLGVEDASVHAEKTLVTFRRVLVGPFKTKAEIKRAKELITDSIQEEFSFWVKRKKKGKFLAVQAFVQEKNSDALVLALAQLGFNPVVERFNRQITCYKLVFTIPPEQRWSHIKKKLEANQIHIIDYRVYPKQVTRPVDDSTATISHGTGS